jgi:hypothetical protein
MFSILIVIKIDKFQKTEEELWRRTLKKGHNETFYTYMLTFVTLGLYPLTLKRETVCSPKSWYLPTRLHGVIIQKTESMNDTRREDPKTLKFWPISCTFGGLRNLQANYMLGGHKVTFH